MLAVVQSTFLSHVSYVLPLQGAPVGEERAGFAAGCFPYSIAYFAHNVILSPNQFGDKIPSSSSLFVALFSYISALV